jgi:hypothetical protein
MQVGVTGHNFESLPPKDHSCHVCFKLTYWFQIRRLLNIYSIGSYVKTKSSHGSHLEFPIGKRFTSLVQDHPMIIPAKSQFNWFGGFWQEDFQSVNQSEHIIGAGSHVEFPICTKNTNLVEDHPMNIYGKFGSNLFSGFREEYSPMLKLYLEMEEEWSRHGSG